MWNYLDTYLNWLEIAWKEAWFHLTKLNLSVAWFSTQLFHSKIDQEPISVNQFDLIPTATIFSYPLKRTFCNGNRRSDLPLKIIPISFFPSSLFVRQKLVGNWWCLCAFASVSSNFSLSRMGVAFSIGPLKWRGLFWRFGLLAFALEKWCFPPIK